MAIRKSRTRGPNTIPLPLNIHRGKCPELAAWVDTLPLGAGAARVRGILEEIMHQGLLLPGGRLARVGSPEQNEAQAAQITILSERLQELEAENAALRRRVMRYEPDLFAAGAAQQTGVATPARSASPAYERTRPAAPVVEPPAPPQPGTDNAQSAGAKSEGKPVDPNMARAWAGTSFPGGGRSGGGRPGGGQ